MEKLYRRTSGPNATSGGTIAYEPEYDVICLRWDEAPRFERLKEALDEVLRMSDSYQCQRLILDCSAVTDLLPGSEWCRNDWAPRAHARGLINLVVIRPGNVLAQLSVNLLAKAISDQVRIHIFTSPVYAREWFSKGNPMVA